MKYDWYILIARITHSTQVGLVWHYYITHNNLEIDKRNSMTVFLIVRDKSDDIVCGSNLNTKQNKMIFLSFL